MKECNIWTEPKTTELGGICGSFRNRQNGASLITLLWMVSLISCQMEVVKMMVMVMLMMVMMVMVVMMIGGGGNGKGRGKGGGGGCTSTELLWGTCLALTAGLNI